MLRRQSLRRLAVATAAMAFVGVAGVGAASITTEAVAQTDPDCFERREVVTGEDANGNPIIGYEYVNVCETPGGGGGGGGPATCEHSTLGEVPCYDAVRGWWSSSAECYVSPMDPQPPAGDPAWGGNDPADGAVYQFACPLPAGGFAVDPRFLDEPPSGPSVAELAQRAIESLVLPEPDIGIAPNPDGEGLVGLPVWMWIAEDTWGPVSTSVSGPGITVTAEGNATQIEWDMGDGTVVVCEGPGTPYEPEYEGEESPDCGHTYTEPSRSQPDGRYQVTATTEWQVEWWVEGGGATGEQFFTRDSSTSVQINELQVVTS